MADTALQAKQWMDGLELIFYYMNGGITASSPKKGFSFQAGEVEEDYSPQYQSSPKPKNRKMSDAELESLTKQMFAATIAGNVQLLRSVLETGISVNLMEQTRSDTPLMIACRAGNDIIVRLCLEFGAKNDPHPDFGHTALHAAVLSAQPGPVAILLQAAAESDADHLIANLADPSGQTPLHIAAEKGAMSIAELLLSHGAKIDEMDGNGRTAVHLSAGGGHKKCLAMLLDHSGDDLLEAPDNYRYTALHCAAENGHLACTRLLLETAADVNARTSTGKSSYTLASSKGHFQVAQLIQEYLHMLRPSSVGDDRSRASSIDSYSRPNPSSNATFKAYTMDIKQANEAETLPRPHMPSPRPSDKGLSHAALPSHSSSLLVEETEPPIASRRGSMNPLHADADAFIEDEGPELVDFLDMDISNRKAIQDSGPNLSPPRSAWSQSEDQFISESVAVATDGYVPPEEEFLFEDSNWSVYYTEEDNIYYLNESGHSQWGDPRVYGVYAEEPETAQGKAFSPRRCVPGPEGSISRPRSESMSSEEDNLIIRTPLLPGRGYKYTLEKKEEEDLTPAQWHLKMVNKWRFSR